MDPNGRIRFLTHEHVGAQIARELLNTLRFSAEATTHTARIVDGHMRPLLMANDPHPPTLRTIYRFLRQFDHAGVDVALLSLADRWRADGAGETAAWEHLGVVIGQLFSHCFDHYEETVHQCLLSGRDLMHALHLKGGPEIGRLLRLLEEAQAAGEITTAEEALALAQQAHAASHPPIRDRRSAVAPPMFHFGSRISFTCGPWSTAPSAVATTMRLNFGGRRIISAVPMP